MSMPRGFYIRKDKLTDCLLIYFDCDYVGMITPNDEDNKVSALPSWNPHKCLFNSVEEAIMELMFHYHYSMKKKICYC
jgi:hypothetical protein